MISKKTVTNVLYGTAIIVVAVGIGAWYTGTTICSIPFLSNNPYDENEKKILENSINPKDLKYGQNDIVGQEALIEKIKKEVIIPLLHFDSFERGAIGLPKGILLFGPPGCGKTMLAQVIAKELDFTFLNISINLIQNKWYGETPKIIKAIFTLAVKIKPCVIFIDEIDSILSNRTAEDHDVTRACKAAFLENWEGISWNEEHKILIIGATNRREFLDQAFISRFDFNYNLSLPLHEQREKFLENELFNLTEIPFDFNDLAKKTRNFSFRDLKYLCKQAKSRRIPANIPDIIKKNGKGHIIDLPKIKMTDFCHLLQDEKFTHYSLRNRI